MLAIVLAVILASVVSFLMTAGVVYLVCLAFGFTFTWIAALAIWGVAILLNSIFGGKK